MHLPKQEKWQSSWLDWQYPDWHQRKVGIQSWKKWLDWKQEVDGAEGLWRIHDGLYDLNKWADRHPGGSMWIRLTKGTDITEVFETHHMTNTAESMLPNLFVRKALKPRNSPFTFHPDGFYKTLKGKIKKHYQNADKGIPKQSQAISDRLAIATLVFSVLAASTQSFVLCFVASLCLTLTVVTAHNFFHQRDNWRMYYFNLSLMSFRDWRVSHALSHHIYTNTALDMEITGLDPIFQWLPKPRKTFFARYLSWLYAPVVYAFIFHVHGVHRMLTEPEGLIGELVPFIIPTAMMLFARVGLLEALIVWNVIIFGASFLFGWIGFNAAHHHPEIFHDGDKHRKDDDWGLHQMDAVRDRIEIKGILPLVLTLFGDHTLHHLFPTIDHSHLDSMYPILEETCKEFGYDLKFMTVTDLIKGQFLQLARNKSN